uniref:Ycf80 n=1 Tax=Alsidium seaforthii TaxID=2007182 RepID=A0A1Z1MCT6_9FLOR|nr:hypothetical protein [Bryothamnion seaforthii]ARW63907.1 hypothetical protein [Bryothamnion seaforthii]
MTLFNLTSLYTPSQNYYFNYNDPIFKANINQQKQQDVLNSLKLKHFKSSSVLRANTKIYSDQLSHQELMNSHHFVSRNFWQKLINRYWQETVFISASNSSSDKYINKLRISGLSIYDGNDYKNFLSKFSKDLLNGKVNLSLKNSDTISTSLFNKANNIYVRYKWYKTWNLNFLFAKYKKNRIYDNKNFHINNSLPLFLLANKNKEIILSESPDRLCRKVTNDQKVYTGLIFISPEDALEYKQYIQNKSVRSTRSKFISTLVASFNIYHRLLKSSNVNTEFRLIPDLKEISDLVYKYQKYRHLSFDQEQNYGSGYFQGQPIYIIKSIPVKSKNSNRLKTIDYNYSFVRNNKVYKYKVAFLNYQTAINAWNRFKKENESYNLPNKPQLYVSNLETFIQRPYYKQNCNEFLFLPSINTYNFVKLYLKQNSRDNFNINDLMINRTLYIKALFYRIIWSLTSRQPVS